MKYNPATHFVCGRTSSRERKFGGCLAAGTMVWPDVERKLLRHLDVVSYGLTLLHPGLGTLPVVGHDTVYAA